MKEQKIYPFLNALKRKEDALDLYYGELKSLGYEGLYEILDTGKEFSKGVANTLSNGGGVIFPHTFVSKCGDQIAAVVHGVLDSGADKVILLGTAHGFPGERLDARIKELNEEDISNEATWGMLDPDSEKGVLLENEFSLHWFNTLWKLEVERRGITPPKVIVRYPCLTNGRPDLLPGIEELKNLLADSVIVGTEDYCHHGVAYGVPEVDALPLNEKGLEFAHDQILKGFSLLEKGEYWSYYDYWMNPLAIGDPTDVTVVMHHLVGQSRAPSIDQLKLVDVSSLFEDEPSPSWVATALISV